VLLELELEGGMARNPPAVAVPALDLRGKETRLRTGGLRTTNTVL
jgi:hypothetical protein